VLHAETACSNEAAGCRKDWSDNISTEAKAVWCVLDKATEVKHDQSRKKRESFYLDSCSGSKDTFVFSIFRVRLAWKKIYNLSE